ncbi:MAG: alpha/beta hydrolase, partial [Anaerolineae bacterium]|nr:alpha/beta hydrolase [Anaerolineae bacterium]
QLLLAEGYGVLVYDQRASGESTGARQSHGLYDQRDITPIIDWLAARPEVEMTRGIGGVGLSLGAHILIGAAPNEPRLSAIWGDGLGINTIADLPPMEGVGNQLITFITGQALWLGERYLGVEFVPNRVLIPQIAPRPLMLVAAGADPYEADFNRGYEPFLGENAELWVIENAGHVGGLWAAPEAYTTRMIDFFDAALRS